MAMSLTMNLDLAPHDQSLVCKRKLPRSRHQSQKGKTSRAAPTASLNLSQAQETTKDLKTMRVHDVGRDQARILCPSLITPKYCKTMFFGCWLCSGTAQTQPQKSTISPQKSLASDVASQRHLMAHQMKNLSVFIKCSCCVKKGHFNEAASGGGCTPKMKNGTPRDELKKKMVVVVFGSSRICPREEARSPKPDDLLNHIGPWVFYQSP